MSRGGTFSYAEAFLPPVNMEEIANEYALIVATAALLATPAFADEVGVGVHAGPVGAGVTVGQPRDDRDRERTTVIKEHEPADPQLSLRRSTMTCHAARPSSKNASEEKGPGKKPGPFNYERA
jgi:hypothetical protein